MKTLGGLFTLVTKAAEVGEEVMTAQEAQLLFRGIAVALREIIMALPKLDDREKREALAKWQRRFIELTLDVAEKPEAKLLPLANEAAP